VGAKPLGPGRLLNRICLALFFAARLDGAARMSPPKHILVVDLDSDVREVICDLLLDLGYRVSLAASDAAMRAFLETADRVDVIVLDATMDEELDLIDSALLAQSKGIRLVMISGNPPTMEAYHERADQLLHKPFRGAELEQAINHALASGTFGQRDEDPD
jgi:DNA-binding NtrC family response regulator